jgi:UDP-N-acetylglucosamine 2-epimerase
MRILTVVGNRPQFIKSAPMSVALREAGIEEIGLHTGCDSRAVKVYARRPRIRNDGPPRRRRA